MSDLKRVVKMAELLKRQKAELEAAKAEIKEKEKAYLQLERVDIPELMSEVGLSEVKLEDGTVIRIKEDVDTKITDATRDAALRWLLDNNFGGIIKTEISLAFPRGAREEAAKVVQDLSVKYEGVQMKENVHSATLKSFVKEQMENGGGVPMDLFNVFPYSKAVVAKK